MLKTQEFSTKDFVMRRSHSIEHQKCKYCVDGIPIAIYLLGNERYATTMVK